MPIALVRWCLTTAAALLALDSVLRIALLAVQGASPSAADALAVVLGGLLRDAAAIAATGALPALLLAAARPPILARPWFRWSAATAVLGTAVFVSAVEWFFFDEFSSRFNHIALDYVLFPYEVLTNIWESYNVPLFVLAAAVAGGLLALPHLRPLRASAAPAGWRTRVAGMLCAVAAGIAGIGMLAVLPDGPSGDRRLREVAANGMQSLARAARTSHLEYDAFYATGDPAAARAAVAASRTSGVDAGFPQRRFTAAGDPGTARPDVVVVLEESLGADFIGCLGDTRGLSPGFDRWAEKGTLLTNLFATGNRTVRGLEGTLCSFPPLPGDAIVKRDRTEGSASLAQVFSRAGYRTEFVYGGAGTFDNLRNFACATGYSDFRDDGVLGTGVFPRDAFRTAWGVADGALFDEVLARQRAAEAERKPLFLTALTVSNHKPYLLPPGHGTDDGWDTRHAFRYAVVGGSLLLLAAVLIVWGRRAVGTGLAVGVSCAVLIGFSVYVYQRVKPSGGRTQAVAYAVDALAGWLDRAEAEGLLRHTVVLVVGDHGARVYGAEQVPLASYRVPGLLLTPEAAWSGRRIDRLCSQIDLAPTLLSLAGISYTAPFFGDDLLGRPSGPGRAFLQHNRDVAAMDDAGLAALGLQKSVDVWRRGGAGGTELAPAPPGEGAALRDLATATYQTADRLYLDRAYRLP